MVSSPIASWQIDGKKLATVSDFIFLGSKVCVDSDCNHIIKTHLLLGRIAMTNLDNVQCIKKQRYHSANKGPNSQSYGFPVVKYGCESWTIKKVECQRIDAFKLLCWRRLLRVPWTASRSNHSVLKEINSEYSLEGLVLKLKLQYFGYPMQRANSLEKTLMLGKIECRRRRG